MSKTIDHSARAHALLSASSAHRWLACPPSAVAQELYPKGKPSEHALEGTLAHEVAEIMVRERLAGNHPDEVNYAEWPAGATHEMIHLADTYADYIQELITDPNALVLLEQRVDFSPWVEDGFGTADCIIIRGSTMDVIDFKFGKGVEVSAKDNPQEMLYGLGALNDYGFAYDIEKVRLHIYQPRMYNVSVDEHTTADMLLWGERVVKPTADLAVKGEGGYNAGMHCRWCAHAGKCPTLTETCSSIVKHHDVEVKVPTLAPFEVANILEAEPLITMWLKRVRETALTGMLNGEQIPGFKVVCGRAGGRKWTDEIEVYKTLESAGLSADDISETKLLSPAALEKSIGKKRVAELVADHIKREPGNPAIAPVTDKRPGYNPADNFRNLEE